MDFFIQGNELKLYCGSGGFVVIPLGVTRIAERAFNECNSMTNVLIPASVRSIGNFAFHKCKNLEQVIISNGLEEIGASAFAACEKLRDVVIPPSVREIGYSAFGNCKSMESISLSEGLTHIDHYAFSDSALRSISLPRSVKEIGGFVFSGCKELEEVHLMEGVESIDTYAFWDCKKLRRISIPASLKVLKENIFNNCESLEEVTLKEGLEEIGENAFSGCSNLRSISIPASVRTVAHNAFCFCDKIAEVEFPVTHVDIIGRAFLLCNHLKTVTVVGGRESKKKREEIKANFSYGVEIKWKPKPGEQGPKKAAARPSAAGSGQSFAKQKGRITFDLPRGYVCEESTDDDGNWKAEIKVNPSVNAKGETEYENTFMVFIKTSEDASAQKSILDTMQEANANATIRRYRGDPDSLLIIASTTGSIFGMPLQVSLVNLLIALSQTEAIMFSCVKSGFNGDTVEFAPVLQQMERIWGSMSIDGKKSVPHDLEREPGPATESAPVPAPAPAAKPVAEPAEEQESETPLDTRVKQDGNVLEIGGRWRMKLPTGVRARYRERNADERFDELALYIDCRKIAGCHLGRTDEERAEAPILMRVAGLLSSKVIGCEMVTVFEADVRKDARMVVHLSLKMDARGESIFEISVAEETQFEVFIQFTPPCTVDDFEEKLQKIKGDDLSAWNGGVHPFGYEWEQYWRMAVCIAASIAPLDEPRKPIDFGPNIPLDGGISVRLPAELKPLKVAAEYDDQSRIVYLPTDGAPTQADLERTDAFPFYVEQQMLMDEKAEEVEADQLENHILQLKLLCKLLVLKMNHPFSVMLCESMSPEGYKAIYLRPVGEGYVVNVLISSIKRRIASWVVQSDSNRDTAELIRIAREIYSRIEFANSSGEMIPFAYPRVADIFHEHFALVTSRSYTTRRDADFVGQPIRELMKEAGNSSEDAYGMMAIPKDSYSLDAEAREFAEVFRLDASLFDPYSDAEAMIRIGMFADVRMFHALRSLAWTVSCKAEREGRQLSDYRFEELKEIGEYIEGKEYLNYATESYCSGLCSHCDWRVFYVPDAYIGSDCEGSTDLRNLCGKENRSGNISFVSIPRLGIGDPRDMHRLNLMVNRNEETLESLEALREDLQKLLPVMRTIRDGFMADRNRAEKLGGPLADALAIAAKEPFYSEEASDQPETDAGLKKPLVRPDGEPVEAARAQKPAGTVGRAAAGRPATPPPSGSVLDLGGATVIAPNQFVGNLTLREIIIPEGVTEIGDGAFNSCMFLETVAFPKSLRKVGRMAFMSCRNLWKVEFAEGVEELGDHAFGATNNLKEVHLPDSLKKVDRNVFGIGGDSPYATAYLSGKLARQLYENSQGNFKGIYARHLVIDGKPFESVEEYLSTVGIQAGGLYSSYSPEAEARKRERRVEEYRSQMEATCRDGKSLQEMIDAARQGIATNQFADGEAFESAVRNLDRSASISFAGKHFALSGFGENEQGVIDEIEKRGGIVRSSMVKAADYLVVCLNAPGAAKVKKALEWREKGAKNQIVSDYQLWQAMLGAAPSASGAAPRAQDAAAEGKATSSGASAPAPAKEAAQPQPRVRKYGWIGDILPEDSDQAQIERDLEAMPDEDAAAVINTFRELKDLRGQLDEIHSAVEQMTREEDSGQQAAEQAKRALEEAERRRVEAQAAERARQEQARQAQNAAGSVRVPNAFSGEDPTLGAGKNVRKKRRIQREIDELSRERDSLRGLFAGIERMKIQRRIDALKEELKKL